MQPEVRKCRRCGKIFAGAPDQLRCSECTRLNLDAARQVDDAVDRLGLDNVDDIVAETGLPRSEVLAIVRETATLRGRVDTGEVCQRCRKLPAQNGSRFCADCRATLTRAFEQASARLLERLVQISAERNLSGTAMTPESAALRMSVNQALNQKRRMARGSRFDPTPHNKYSG